MVSKILTVWTEKNVFEIEREKRTATSNRLSFEKNKHASHIFCHVFVEKTLWLDT